MTAGDAQGLYFAAFFDDLIDGLLSDAGHGADFLADVCARADKHRIDQPRGGEAGFADEIAKGFGAAQAAGAMGGETHPCLAPAMGCAWRWPRNAHSSASMTASVVVSAAITMRWIPYSRSAADGYRADGGDREFVLEFAQLLFPYQVGKIVDGAWTEEKNGISFAIGDIAETRSRSTSSGGSVR